MRAARHNHVVFFFSGMCLTYPWNAINAAVDAISDELGRDAYVLIQAAYYLPLLPCLLCQTWMDARYDVRYGLQTAYSCRFLGSAVGMACAVGLFLPLGVFSQLTLGRAVVLCCGVGMAQSIAFGAACQCAARFHGSSPMLLFTCGYQASPCLVLALTLLTRGARFSSGADGADGLRSPPQATTVLYWGVAAGLALAGLALLTAYICCSTEATTILAEADAQLGVGLGGGGSSRQGYVRLSTQDGLCIYDVGVDEQPTVWTAAGAEELYTLEPPPPPQEEEEDRPPDRYVSKGDRRHQGRQDDIIAAIRSQERGGLLVSVGRGSGAQLLSDEADEDGQAEEEEEEPGRRGTPRGQHVIDTASASGVLAVVWPCVVAALLSYTQGLLVVCLLPFVPEQSSRPVIGSVALSQKLVFVNLFANLAGRLFAITTLGAKCGANRSPRCVLGLACARSILLLPFGWYHLPSHHYHDQNSGSTEVYLRS
jgi:hypothetical protein